MPVVCSKIHSLEQLFLYTQLGMVSLRGGGTLVPASTGNQRGVVGTNASLNGFEPEQSGVPV